MRKILIIEDESSIALTLKEYLRASSFDIHLCHDGYEGLHMIQKIDPEIILLDLGLPDMDGLDILKHIEKHQHKCAAIVITGNTDTNVVVEAMQLGAYDFVPKPVSPDRLKTSIKNALERIELKKIAQSYEIMARDGFQGFVGKSPTMQAVYTMIENAGPSNAPVFITGESGTGKELAARALHDLSPRAKKPFEVLNCAAIPNDLLESVIFGHVKGAFTGATSDRKGAATRADGGTFFLDELGEMPMALQAKLLRFIQTGTFKAVGDSRQQTVDVRFICATNRDPLDAVHQGLLREDLYYRLNVIPVHLPPLRDRGQDILLLAHYYLKKYSAEENKDFKDFSPEAVQLLEGNFWSGNVRELENTIRRVVILNNSDTVDETMLSEFTKKDSSTLSDDHSNNVIGTFLPRQESDVKTLLDYEKNIIQAVLAVCDGNITKAARMLGINPATIHRKQKQWS